MFKYYEHHSSSIGISFAQYITYVHKYQDRRKKNAFHNFGHAKCNILFLL